VACADKGGITKSPLARSPGPPACLAPKEHLVFGEECSVFEDTVPDLGVCVRKMVLCPPSSPCLQPAPWPTRPWLHSAPLPTRPASCCREMQQNISLLMHCSGQNSVGVAGSKLGWVNKVYTLLRL